MITSMRSRVPFIAFGLAVGLFCNALTALAWTEPTASAPGANVAAPVNVGTVTQVKNGNLTVNNMSIFGNASIFGNDYLVGASRYLNFNVDATNATTITNSTGANGYGVRDNAGILQFKNSGGSWASLQSTIATLLTNSNQTFNNVTANNYCLGASCISTWPSGSKWNTTGSNIYYTTGNVGVGTNNPTAKLHVGGTAGTDGIRFPDGTLQTTAASGGAGTITVQTFTASGTWTKPSGVKQIKVTVTGGGGSSETGNGINGSPGNASSFGSYNSAGGGSAGGSGSGGVATGGDINIPGARGADPCGSGGSSFWGGIGVYGSGAFANCTSPSNLGGGAGATVIEYIDVTAVSSVAVTVGAPATGGTGGIVVVEEYR